MFLMCSKSCLEWTSHAISTDPRSLRSLWSIRHLHKRCLPYCLPWSLLFPPFRWRLPGFISIKNSFHIWGYSSAIAACEKARGVGREGFFGAGKRRLSSVCILQPHHQPTSPNKLHQLGSMLGRHIGWPYRSASSPPLVAWRGWPMATDIAHFGEDELAEGMSSQTRSKNQQKLEEGLVVPPLWPPGFS